jgi:hypothetical protein
MVAPMSPGTSHAWRRIVPLNREVTNCRRKATPKMREGLLMVFISYSFFEMVAFVSLTNLCGYLFGCIFPSGRNNLGWRSRFQIGLCGGHSLFFNK